MAKRKRLTPANPAFLGGSEVERTKPTPGAEREDREGKGYPLGMATTPDSFSARTRPPIAEIAADVSVAAALKELSDEFARARQESRLILPLRLAEIDNDHLVRDRISTGEEDLAALVESLRSRGQQTPIEVVDRGAGEVPRYGLISGWRRMAALERLAVENPKFGQVLALVRTPESASEAYVAMVEENEIRVGLSYYERARVVLKAVEQGVYPDLKTSLSTLFRNVSRAKRSKIKSFTRLVEGLDGTLSFPTAIGERLGLEVAKRLEDEPGLEAYLRGRLSAAPPATAEEEREILTAPGVDPSRPSKGRQTSIRSVETTARGSVHIRYEAAKGRAVLTGLDEESHVALLDWLGSR